MIKLTQEKVEVILSYLVLVAVVALMSPLVVVPVAYYICKFSTHYLALSFPPLTPQFSACKSQQKFLFPLVGSLAL